VKVFVLRRLAARRCPSIGFDFIEAWATRRSKHEDPEPQREGKFSHDDPYKLGVMIQNGWSIFLWQVAQFVTDCARAHAIESGA